MKSRLVVANPSRPLFPSTIISSGLGLRPSTISAPQLPFSNVSPSLHPLRIPYGSSLISLKPGANWIGRLPMVAPAARARSKVSLVLSSIPVACMTSWTAPCNFPPGVVKSFWNSIRTTAVDEGFIDRLGLDLQLGQPSATSPTPKGFTTGRQSEAVFASPTVLLRTMVVSMGNLGISAAAILLLRGCAHQPLTESVPVSGGPKLTFTPGGDRFVKNQNVRFVVDETGLTPYRTERKNYFPC